MVTNWSPSAGRLRGAASGWGVPVADGLTRRLAWRKELGCGTWVHRECRRVWAERSSPSSIDRGRAQNYQLHTKKSCDCHSL